MILFVRLITGKDIGLMQKVRENQRVTRAEMKHEESRSYYELQRQKYRPTKEVTLTKQERYFIYIY